MPIDDKPMGPSRMPWGHQVPLLKREDLPEIRRRHTGTSTRIWGPDDTYEVCMGCGQQTCDTLRLLDYIEALEAGRA